VAVADFGTKVTIAVLVLAHFFVVCLFPQKTMNLFTRKLIFLWLLLLVCGVFCAFGTYFAIVIQVNFFAYSYPSATLETTENADLFRGFLVAVAVCVAFMMALISMAASYSLYPKRKPGDPYPRRYQMALSALFVLVSITIGSLCANYTLAKLTKEAKVDAHNGAIVPDAMVNYPSVVINAILLVLLAFWLLLGSWSIRRAHSSPSLVPLLER
jgi:hypothetical protein